MYYYIAEVKKWTFWLQGKPDKAEIHDIHARVPHRRPHLCAWRHPARAQAVAQPSATACARSLLLAATLVGPRVGELWVW